MKAEGVSIIIPVFNKLDITRKCVDHIRGANGACAFETIVVDNGSTDGTPEVFSRDPDLIYIRNEQDVGLSKAYNIAAGKANYDMYCFMHNDVFVYGERWTDKIRDFVMRTPGAGVVGLYGAKHIRKDGSFRGKTIVHAKMGAASIRSPFEKVAVVDGLLLASSEAAFNEVGGFDEGFTFHFYDKDFSMRSIGKGLDNYVLDIPFEHLCAATRSQIRDDDLIRRRAQGLFVDIWGGHLPADVSTFREKIAYSLRAGHKH